jgi:hypothetical protein
MVYRVLCTCIPYIIASSIIAETCTNAWSSYNESFILQFPNITLRCAPTLRIRFVHVIVALPFVAVRRHVYVKSVVFWLNRHISVIRAVPVFCDRLSMRLLKNSQKYFCSSVSTLYGYAYLRRKLKDLKRVIVLTDFVFGSRSTNFSKKYRKWWN